MKILFLEKKILSTILIFASIKNTWFELSQNKTECLSRIFVVNRMASGFFLSIFLPGTEKRALYKFQPNIQTSREEQWNSWSAFLEIFIYV